MAAEEQERNLPEEAKVGDPKKVEPGKGAPGEQWAVQTAQTTEVNPEEENIPSAKDEELNREQVEKLREKEKETGMKTTAGYTIGESSSLNNFPVEPPMRVEKDEES